MKKFVKVLALMMCVVMGVVMLTACTPSTPEKAEAKMKDAGYACISIDMKDYAEYEGLTGGVVATKITDTIVVLYFDSGKTAKTAYEKIDADKKYDKKTIGKSGNTVYFGSEQAVKDFK